MARAYAMDFVNAKGRGEISRHEIHFRFRGRGFSEPRANSVIDQRVSMACDKRNGRPNHINPLEQSNVAPEFSFEPFPWSNAKLKLTPPLTSILIWLLRCVMVGPVAQALGIIKASQKIPSWSTEQSRAIDAPPTHIFSI
jgi:hypothetical protein